MLITKNVCNEILNSINALYINTWRYWHMDAGMTKMLQ